MGDGVSCENIRLLPDTWLMLMKEEILVCLFMHTLVISFFFVLNLLEKMPKNIPHRNKQTMVKLKVRKSSVITLSKLK